MLHFAVISIFFIIAQSGNVASVLQWDYTLTDILTQRGVPDNSTIGYSPGSIRAQGATGSVTYSSNSTNLAVDSTTGRVSLQSQLVYSVTPSFVVRFTAADTGNSNDTIYADVIVNVISTGNHAPLFDLDSYSITVLECSNIGEVVYDQIKAVDGDTGLEGILTASCVQTPGNSEDQAACSTFNITIIQQASGSYLVSLVLARRLSYVTKSSYTMNVAVKDGGNPPLSATAQVLITVKFGSDSTPVFVNAPISFFFTDGQENGTVMTTVRARIPCFPDRRISIKISSDAAGWFTADPTTYNSLGFYQANIRTNGRISSSSLLFDYGGRYQFTVIAIAIISDIESQITNTVTATVTLLSSNNNPPRFSSSVYFATVLTGLTVGSFVPSLSMIVSDADGGDAAFFTLTAVSNPRPVNNIFGLSPSFGQGTAAVSMTVLQPSFLGFTSPANSQYNVTVTAFNNKTQAMLSGSAVVVINVVQAGVLPPYFGQASYSISVYDSENVGNLLTDKISAYNYNTGLFGLLRYAIASGDASYISVDPTTCAIYLNRKLNYTVVPVLNYVLSASLGSFASATVPLTIRVLDSNSQGLRFSKPEYDANVPEMNTTMVPSVTIQVTNLQRDRVPSFRILNPTGLVSSLFTVDPNTGVVLMTRGVDYNETPNRQGFFEFTVEASDNFINPLTSTVSVRIYITDLNNHAPTFPNTTYSTTIPEDTPPGSFVVQVNATDADVNQNALVTYLLGTGGRDKFTIDPNTGRITVAPNADLSLDRNPSRYNVTVLANDNGSPQLTGTTTVYVTVDPSQTPVFDTSNYVFYVQDNLPVSSIVGAVAARVQGSTTGISYSALASDFTALDRNNKPVTNATSQYDYKTMFAVNVSSGAISVGSQLSWNYAAVVQFKVVATNNRVPSRKTGTAGVTVYIRSSAVRFVPTLPSNNTVVVTINEQLPIGTSVPYRVQAVSDNPLATFIYQKTNGSDPVGYLAVGQSTGIITVAKTIVYDVLPSPKAITLYVEAREQTAANRSATVTVIVQILKNRALLFNQSSYTYVLYTNATIGSRVGAVNATDVVPGFVGDITYAYSGDLSNFALDPASGMITVSSNLNTPNEQAPYYRKFIVTATGPGVLNLATATVSITVLNATSAGPVFFGTPYSFRIFDTNRNGTSVGLVGAVDFWSRGTDPIYYYLEPGPDNGPFSINSPTGEIKLTQDAAKFARLTPYILNVSARAGNPARVSYTLVYISIINSTTDSEVPYFINPPADGLSFPAPELQSNAFVIKVEGSTSRPNVTVKYYFQVNNASSTTAENFIIDPETGSISVNGNGLNIDVKRNYQLTLLLRDTGNPTKESTRSIVVNVKPANIPSFERCPNYVNPLTVHVKENETNGYLVTTLSACNRDPSAPVFYYIIGGNGPNAAGSPAFAIPRENGSILLTGGLNIYTNPQYNLTVAAFSQSGVNITTLLQQNASRITVNVIVDDIDNFGPSFDTSTSPSTNCKGIGLQVNGAVRDFPSPAEAIIRMYAGDCDISPDNRKHSYSISGITFNSPYTLASRDNDRISSAFYINNATGDVISGLTNYRPYSFGKFKVSVTATDSFGRSDTSQLYLYVIRESDVLKYTLNANPKDVRSQSTSILSKLASNAEAGSAVDVNGVNVHYHIVNDSNVLDNFGYEEWLNRPYIHRKQTDLCFYLANNDRVLNADNLRSVFPNLSPLSAADNQTYPYRCYPHLTTHWWSGYFWVWWWLIALALLIFLIALILIIVLCCIAISAEQQYYSSQPYVWLDAPIAPPASEFEYHGDGN